MATIIGVNPRRRRINSQQLAWVVMLLSFAVFCAILIIVIVGVQYFLFQSRIPLRSVVNVSRGTVTLIDSDLNQTAVTKSDEMSYGTVATTDTQSQASISFVDTQHDNQLIASVTIENGASLNLKQDSRPRFDLSSDAPYWLDFRDVYGEFDVFVPDQISRPILISFATTLGPSARLTTSGHYTVIAVGSQVRVVNYSGGALLSANDSNRMVPAGQTASLSPSDDQFTLAPLTNLLGEATFTPDNVIDVSTSPDLFKPLAWRCNNIQDDGQPMGSFGLMNSDGRPVLHLFRGDNAESHGETFCVQGFGTGVGLDLSPYSSVSIRATFKIHSQSLSTCGTQGSECPLMLKMDYLPKSGGNLVTWYHGFYAVVDPSRFYPLNCSGCEQHEQINPDVWYTYDSHNFFETFTPESVPQSIFNLKFYASGHQYDVDVSQVALLVDQGVVPLTGS